MKKALLLILITVLICSALYITFKREFDQFNPLYKEEYVYAVINEPAKLEGKEYIRYRYNLTGYTDQGQKKKITFSSSNEQEQGAYVKVLAKGAYTMKWNIIQQEEVPDKALVNR